MVSPARVLLVEDDPDHRELSTLALERAGFVVTPASTVAAARALLSARTFDVLLTDAYLPDGHVRDIVHELPQEQMPRVGIVLSGAPREEHGTLQGVRVFLLKPVDFPSLGTFIRCLLGE